MRTREGGGGEGGEGREKEREGGRWGGRREKMDGEIEFSLNRLVRLSAIYVLG